MLNPPWRCALIQKNSGPGMAWGSGEIEINCTLECGGWDIKHCVNLVKTV